MFVDNPKPKRLSGVPAMIVGLLLIGLAFYTFLALSPKHLVGGSFGATWLSGVVAMELVGITWLLGLILFLRGLRKLGQHRPATIVIGVVIAVISIAMFIWL